jgi:hypothetical protein
LVIRASHQEEPSTPQLRLHLPSAEPEYDIAQFTPLSFSMADHATARGIAAQFARFIEILRCPTLAFDQFGKAVSFSQFRHSHHPFNDGLPATHIILEEGLMSAIPGSQKSGDRGSDNLDAGVPPGKNKSSLPGERPKLV